MGKIKKEKVMQGAYDWLDHDELLLASCLEVFAKHLLWAAMRLGQVTHEN